MLTAACLERHPSVIPQNVLCLMNGSWRVTTKPRLEAWELCVRISPHSCGCGLVESTRNCFPPLPKPSSVVCLPQRWLAVWHWALFSFKHNYHWSTGKKGEVAISPMIHFVQQITPRDISSHAKKTEAMFRCAVSANDFVVLCPPALHEFIQGCTLDHVSWPFFPQWSEFCL